MPHHGKIPRPTAKRLSLYLRELESRIGQGETTISSKQLGQALGLTDAQVRKDLAFFGQFGHPGIGYPIGELIARLRSILGTDREWHAVVVGAGNIGRALLAYGRFQRKGFRIVAVFDDNPRVIGSDLAGHTVLAMSALPALVRQQDVKIGIVAVPAEAAQAVADQLIAAGVPGILNFAPKRLDVKNAVSVVSVDFSVALEQLAFQVSLGFTGSLDEE
ncbi:MAG: redox-sensing transcriptional repressor Rex [Phycisphaerales bacterium]|nr:redox-sensing transcriptional repressor Rex [Phycisphaerales bacterium]